jgi:hypothetical protein
MNRMGFDKRLIHFILSCVTTVQYSIIVNGNPVGLIYPTRGIRKGDPLSPYLFLLCAEVLSMHLQHATLDGSLTGVPTSPRGLRLNHLFFVDNNLPFLARLP